VRPYLHKNKAGGVAQGEGPEFKPQYCKNKKWSREINLTVFSTWPDCAYSLLVKEIWPCFLKYK
jgi:hypothetical protein